MTDDKLIVYTGGVLTKGVAEAEDAAAAAAAAAELAGGEADRAEIAAEDAQAAADALSGAIDDIATAQETADDALEEANTAIATQARRDFGKWHLVDYLHPDDMAAALEGDVAGQDVDRVTAAIQQMFFDFFTFWSAGNNRNAEIVFPKAALAINDEMLGEDSAQILWDMTGGNNGGCRVTIQTNGVEFHCRNWVARARIRTSGFYAAHGISYAVPTVVFRWEQQAQNSWCPEFSGKWSIAGQSSIANDPVGVLIRNSRQPKMRGLNIRRLYNHMFMTEGVMNGDFDDLDLFWGGYQPTEFGGEWGHMPAAVRFSNVGAVVTATEAVFTADHVGKQFCLARSGATDQGTRLNHWSTIASVDSDTQITLTNSPAVNVSGQTGSFEAMRVSCAGNSSVCTMSAAISGDLTGRYVTIIEAHTAGAVRSGTVTSVIVSHSGDQITLAHELAEPVTDRLIVFSPMLWADAVPENQIRNDNLGFGNLRCESTGSSVNACVPAIIGKTGGIISHNAKLHGCAASQNNFGGTAAGVVFGHARGIVFDGSLEQAGNSPRWANAMFAGDQMIVHLLGKITAYSDSNTSAYAYISPTIPAADVQADIYWGLQPPTPAWPQESQTPVRLGANGRDYMISAYGSERGTGIFASRFGEISAIEYGGPGVAQTPIDSALGRVMKVGYGHNTGAVQPPIVSDLQGIAVVMNRRVRTDNSTLNKPDSDNYIVDVVLNTTGNYWLIARASSGTEPKIAVCRYNGTWSPWRFIDIVRSGGTGGRPSSPYPWQQYADTTLGHPIWWNGTAWVNASGATV